MKLDLKILKYHFQLEVSLDSYDAKRAKQIEGLKKVYLSDPPKERHFIAAIKALRELYTPFMDLREAKAVVDLWGEH